jgi:hypothetical protein
MVNGLLIAMSDEGLSSIAERLRDPKLPIEHPMIVPTLISESLNESSVQARERDALSICRLEYLSGEFNWPGVSKPTQDSETNYRGLTAQMSTANSSAASNERLCNFQLDLNEFIRESIDYVQLVAPERDKNRFKHEAKVLREYLYYLTADAKCLLFAAQTQQKNVQGLTSAVCIICRYNHAALTSDRFSILSRKETAS